MNIPDKYNPLDSISIAKSIALALHQSPEIKLEDVSTFSGAGVYAIFYRGNSGLYSPIAGTDTPIYVGKAVSPGSRKIGCNITNAKSCAVYGRLQDHVDSVEAATNLNIEDFSCKVLLLDDMWISVAEAYLIQQHRPVWNMMIEGFGNHDPGKGRYKQQKSLWDTIHAGRPWAEKLQSNTKGQEHVLASVRAFLSGPSKTIAPKSQARATRHPRQPLRQTL